MDLSKSAVDVAVPHSGHSSLCYLIDEHEQVVPGQILEVPFRSKVLFAVAKSSPYPLTQLNNPDLLKKLKPIKRVLPYQLPSDLLETCLWASKYYHSNLGDLFSICLPKSFTGKKHQSKVSVFNPNSFHKLTDEQQDAKNKLSNLENRVILLRGPTGSGKTEVYIELIKEALAQNRSVLYLVPEIALTAGLHSRLESRLQMPVALWHSEIPAAQKSQTWLDVYSNKTRVAFGARSALFLPLQNLGLIIVDEEHEQSYKQEERSKYHARDLAIKRASLCGARTVLGSATPSFETEAHVKNRKYGEVVLSRPFNQEARTLEFIDLRSCDKVPELNFILSNQALTEIKLTLMRNEQALIFLNKKGYAPFLLCQDCNYVPECPSCSVSLTYYKKRCMLQCHMCGYQESAPSNCSKCFSHEFYPIGSGTEAIEEGLTSLVPEAKIIRLDRSEVTSHSRLKNIVNDFENQKFNILVGTQMVVKGHDFSNVTLVLVLLADSFLKFPDFRSSEFSYQILTQVMGRGGRRNKSSKILIQTFMPDHPVLKALESKESITEFFKSENEIREALNYPPFSRLAQIRFSSRNERTALVSAQNCAQTLEPFASVVKILGPTPSIISKVKDDYRFDLLLKSVNIKDLHQVLSLIETLKYPGCDISIDVDPIHV